MLIPPAITRSAAGFVVIRTPPELQVFMMGRLLLKQQTGTQSQKEIRLCDLSLQPPQFPSIKRRNGIIGTSV